MPEAPAESIFFCLFTIADQSQGNVGKHGPGIIAGTRKKKEEGLLLRYQASTTKTAKCFIVRFDVSSWIWLGTSETDKPAHA